MKNAARVSGRRFHFRNLSLIPSDCWTAFSYGLGTVAIV